MTASSDVTHDASPIVVGDRGERFRTVGEARVDHLGTHLSEQISFDYGLAIFGA